MKKILILGANEKQVQLIRAAKEEGYRVVVCDYTDDHPGIALADKHYQVSYLDREAVLSIARSEQVDGVIGNNDPAMPMVACIAGELGLVGNPPQSIERLVSKSAFRRLQERAGLYCPRHVELEDSGNLEEAVKDFTYPIIVKPSVCAATQGTTKIYGSEMEKLPGAFEVCRQFSRDGKVTIEEYVEMPSLDVIEGDIFVLGDQILWNGLFTTRRSPMAPMIPMTYIFPAILDARELSAIQKSITLLFREAGIRHGEYNVEMYFTTKGELFVIEVNPRQGGHMIPQWILRHTGIDFTRLLVTTAVGDTGYAETVKDSKPLDNYLTHHVVFSDRTGVLERIELDPLISNYVTDIVYHRQCGEKVSRRVNGTDYIAYVTMEFPDRATQLACSGDRIEELIVPFVKN